MAHRRRAAAAMAGVVPRAPRRRGDGPNDEADEWVDGNPNRDGARAKGKKGGGKVRHIPGVPDVEYAVIELTKDDLVADDRVNRANRKLVKYYNQIKSARVQILETSIEIILSKKSKLGKGKGSESRPTKPELNRLKVSLQELMSRMEEMMGAVRRVGGIPKAPPRHFSKGLGV